MLHRANTATTYSLAFLEILEKILIIHWYMWLYCLLSAIIIHTEDLLHCKWWKPESRGKKNRTERQRRRQMEKLREWELRRHTERSFRQRKRERVTYALSNDEQNVCNYVLVWQIKASDLQSFCCCGASKPRRVKVKIRIFFPFIWWDIC